MDWTGLDWTGLNVVSVGTFNTLMKIWISQNVDECVTS